MSESTAKQVNVGELSWSQAAAREAMLIACAAVGVVFETIELIRFGTNAVYLLGPTPVVVRVSRPGADLEGVRAEFEIARWLGDQGIRVAQPADWANPEPQPVYTSVVSFWEYVEHDRRREPSPADFAEALKRFHEVGTNYPGQLPAWNPLEFVARHLRRLTAAGQLAREDAKTLWSWHHWLEPRVAEITPETSELGFGLLHGDAHRGNCLVGPDGCVLLDFDRPARGPLEWDLIPEPIGPRPFGTSREDYELFATTYGYDVTSWERFQDLALLRELLITAWRLEADAISEVRTESELRLRYWRREDPAPFWHAF